MRHETTFVFHNIDGDGVPTQIGDVIGLVECPKDMDRIRRLFPNHTLYRREMNYRVAALINKDRVKVKKVFPVLIHKAQRKPPTPRRTALVIDCEIEGYDCRIIISHAINSAWAPLWKPTTHRRARRELWWAWFNKINFLVTQADREDRLVILLADTNRSRGKWSFSRLLKKWVHGPDAVFVSSYHRAFPLVTNKNVGPKTGNGRVTHASLKFALSLNLPERRA